ncbi:MAG TPA: diacylglycerol kinase family protein [Pseudomonadales bacterium]|nr:diacylglycerol kinase family protein [Pseudomonadales bacterium]
MRSAILTNPHSNRNRRHLPRLRTELARHPEIRHVETPSLDDLPAAVEQLLRDNVELIGINGGDGTVHLALTALLQATAGQALPAVALLPGGTTSMSARGVNGGVVRFERALDNLLEAAGGKRCGQARHLVRVQPVGASAQLGLCMGMGAIVSGIEYCHERIYKLGLRDERAAGMALLRAGWGIARREAVFSDGVPIDVDIDGEHRSARASIFLVTTLNELLLGIRPFWGNGAGPLKITLVREHVQRFLRNFPDLLRGRPDPHLTEAAGYFSRRGERVGIRCDGPYMIDGEIYRAQRGELTVDAFGPVTVVPLGDAA